MQICTLCKINKKAQNGKQRWCNECRNENAKKNRKKYSELTEIQKKKSNCRSYSNVYKRSGKILINNCVICGKKAEKHHEDYDKPLKVVWLCRKHHLKKHKLTFDKI